tara:strand:- start:98582 stop:100240 length:1659 start_codon:yes stop_codon:yes gene_type:complete
MRQFFKTIPLFAVVLFAACSTSQPLSTPADDPEPEIVEDSPEVVEIDMPANDWYLQTSDASPYYGTGVERAYNELLKDKTPGKEVVVAIIDSGTDIEHEDLKENIWINEDEIPDNGIDDDNNGYIDDIHGWNFIGGKDGEHVNHDTYEVTRLYAALKDEFADADTTGFTESEWQEYDYYLEIKDAYEAESLFVHQNLTQIRNINMAVQGAKQVLGVSDLDSVSAEQLEPSANDGPYLQQAKQLVGLLRENDVKESDFKEALDQFESLATYSLDTSFDPRPIVGDDYEDLTDRSYGNNDVAGVHNLHGTHVAGIVGAVRDNGLGINGIADVKLMIIRTVPDGDERDKDVANAIRYAAENGADVINMSFGKGFSPQKEYVDAAVKFADSLGVLLVHGSGNDGENVDTLLNYPNKYYADGGEATNFINVGASSWKSGEELAASFSNFGDTNVDIFAPGVSIYSSVPDNEYEENDGTSMASPVVAGVAALIMSYYPDLTATQVKEILLKSVTIPSVSEVMEPGTGEEVPFSSLSVSNGIVNAYKALQLAEQISNSK